MDSESEIIKAKYPDQQSQHAAVDEFMAAKAERKASFVKMSEGISIAQAVNDAKLIKNLKPSDVKIVKFSE